MHPKVKRLQVHLPIIKNKWLRKKTKPNETVGRIYFVSLTMGEKYYLRLLLLRVTVAESFNYLKTFNEIEYNTFKEAAITRGLLENDNEYENCVNEAITNQSPHALRMLFSTLLLHCDITDPVGLWEKKRKFY
jgi:hypothetical protein